MTTEVLDVGIQIPRLDDDPYAILEELKKFGSREPEARLALIGVARQRHDLAMMESVELEKVGEDSRVAIPCSILFPRIVGAELICLLATRRKEVGREVKCHPEDALKYLIVPR